MTATAQTRRPDVVGGIEVRQVRGGWFLICPPGGGWENSLTDGLPRKRNAVAVRSLLLAEIPDWEAVAAAGRLPDTEAGCKARDIGRMVKKVADRAGRHGCLGCGYRSCACGTDGRLDGPHYTDAELAWFR